MAIANVKKYSMDMEIPEISKLDKIWSPEISIHGIPWKVKVCKKGHGEYQTLTVRLFCANKNKSPNWSLWGSAVFKLMPYDKHDDDDDANPIEYHTPTYVYDASGHGYGGHLVQWKDLFNPNNKFVKDDIITLKIEVTAENPTDPNRSRLNFECIQKCCDNCHFGKFRLTVANIVSLSAMQSPRFKLRGLPWYLQISKLRSSHLGVLLLLNKNADEELSKMTMTVKLVSSKQNVQPIEKCITKQYQYLGNLSAVPIVSWDKLVKAKNGFVNDDSITLEIEIGTENSNGGAKPNPKTDVKLLHMECAICLEIIDGQKLGATPCGHLFCLECITKVVNDRAACPTCETPLHLISLRPLYLPVIN